MLRIDACYAPLLTARSLYSDNTLAVLARRRKNKQQIKYGDIPGFPKETTVVGHKGEVVIGQLAGVTTICFRGRFHCYEGHPLKRVVLPGKKMAAAETNEWPTTTHPWR